jgi:hypothetical protein
MEIDAGIGKWGRGGDGECGAECMGEGRGEGELSSKGVLGEEVEATLVILVVVVVCCWSLL